MKVPLEVWALKHFSPPPSVHTLRRMAREGRITPPPVKVGKQWYVDEAARLRDDEPPRGHLVDRLRGGRR